MKTLFLTPAGRLRILGWLEGVSLLILVFVAVPAKYIFGYAQLSRFMGPLHGALFLLFVFNTLSIGVLYRWRFRATTWKVLLACIVPFGTFYIDRRILSKLPPAHAY